MAIKGKRKGKSSRSRRPARSPRLPASVHRPRPFYRTGWGKGIIGGILAVVLIVVLVAASRARDEARLLEERQGDLDGYTGQMHEIHQNVQQIAAAMNAVAPEVAPADLESLEGDAEGWSQTLAETEAQLAPMAPPPGAEAAHRIFVQAISAYGTAARTYAAVGEVPGRARAQVMARAVEIRDLAGSTWQTGIEALDRARADAELDASRLDLPPPQAFPPPEAEEPEQEDEGGGD